MTTPTGLVLREIVPGDIAGLMALARAAFEVDWTDAFVDWKYFQNPAGAAVGACAVRAGRLVASFSHTPARLKLGAETTLAMQAVDAMVAPDYRRQKLFAQLARQTYQRLDAAGTRLAYVFPAAAVRTPFVGQFGYTEVGAAPRFVKVIQGRMLGASLGRPGPKAWLDRLAAAAGRARASGPAPAPAGLQISETDQFDARFDQLWQQVSGGLAIATIRDAAYLTWRYKQNPLHDYVILTAMRADQLAGYVVLAVQAHQPVASVVEFMVDPLEAAAGHGLLVEAASRAREAGCAQLQCWMLPQHTRYVRWLEHAGFVYWPNRLLPGWLRYATPLIVRSVGGPGLGPAATQLDNWFLSMGDHDYY